MCGNSELRDRLRDQQIKNQLAAIRELREKLIRAEAASTGRTDNEARYKFALEFILSVQVDSIDHVRHTLNVAKQVARQALDGHDLKKPLDTSEM